MAKVIHSFSLIQRFNIMTYYDFEFKKLGEDAQADLQLRSFNGETRWLTISADKVKAILAILNIDEEDINK